MSEITGKRLQELREKKGLSKSEVAKLLGISRPSYVNYENGKNNPSRTIDKLCTLFGVSADYILGTDVKQIPINIHMFGDDSEEYTSDEKNLIKIYRTLPEHMQKLLITTAQGFQMQAKEDNRQERNNA